MATASTPGSTMRQPRARAHTRVRARTRTHTHAHADAHATARTHTHMCVRAFVCTQAHATAASRPHAAHMTRTTVTWVRCPRTHPPHMCGDAVVQDSVPRPAGVACPAGSAGCHISQGRWATPYRAREFGGWRDDRRQRGGTIQCQQQTLGSSHHNHNHRIRRPHLCRRQPSPHSSSPPHSCGMCIHHKRRRCAQWHWPRQRHPLCPPRATSV